MARNFCPMCGTPLAPGRTSCPGCGRLFDPEETLGTPEEPQASEASENPAPQRPGPAPQEEMPAPPAEDARASSPAAEGAAAQTPPRPMYAPQGPVYAPPSPPQMGAPRYAPYRGPGGYHASEMPEYIGFGGYLGMSVAGLLPVIGYIFLLIWSFDSAPRPNRRNFARGLIVAKLIMDVVLFVGAFALAFFIGMLGYYYY